MDAYFFKAAIQFTFLPRYLSIQKRRLPKKQPSERYSPFEYYLFGQI